MTKDLLKDVVQTPCLSGWENMDGDERVRFCGACKKNVFNLGDMTKEEAESTIEENGGKLCVRIFRRKDGSVYTDNCPRRLRRLRNHIRTFAPFAFIFLSWIFNQSPSDAQGLVGAPIDGGFHRSYSEESIDAASESINPAMEFQGLLALVLSYAAGVFRINKVGQKMRIWTIFGASQRVTKLFLQQAILRNGFLFFIVPTILAVALYFTLLHDHGLSIFAGGL